MTINIYLNNDRTYQCDNLIIGKTYENEATIRNTRRSSRRCS